MPYKDESVRKKKHKEYSRNYYEKNKARILAANDINKATHKQKWEAYKSTLSCSKCNFAHPAALDFHHEDPTLKEHNIHRLVANKQFTKAHEEIKKCVVLCANCHRIYHYEEKYSTLATSP